VPYSHYPVLLGIGTLTLLALIILPRSSALRRRFESPRDNLRRPQLADGRDA
jgi:hypothetical protein